MIRSARTSSDWGIVSPSAFAVFMLQLFKTGGPLIRHARYFVLQLAESHLTSRLFGQIVGRIERLAWHPT
jgi:hypothetical protein